MNIRRRATTVFLDSLGCKLNQAEMEVLGWELEELGYAPAASPYDADVYILNTCTVTGTADAKSRRRLKRVKRLNPCALVVAVGCYAHRVPGLLRGVVDIVVDNVAKSDLAALIKEAGFTPSAPVGWGGVRRRTRSMVKVQDGCDNRCAYCIVPLVRGGSRSISPDEVLDQVSRRVESGYMEVVLTGVEVGSYSWGEVGLSGLIERILAETGVARLRLSSLQPSAITPGLIDLWRDSRLCPHFHLALQSGSDAVLGRMGRRYNVAEYEAALRLIKDGVPDAAVTTDVMVGFPGESDGEFRDSLSLCRRMGFARMHVFAYSPRPGTRAASMPDKVEDKVKKARSKEMLALAADGASVFREGFLGGQMTVLFEEGRGGVWSGLAGNYIRVYVPSAEDLTNKLLLVRLKRVHGDGVWGEIEP